MSFHFSPQIEQEKIEHLIIEYSRIGIEYSLYAINNIQIKAV